MLKLLCLGGCFDLTTWLMLVLICLAYWRHLLRRLGLVDFLLGLVCCMVVGVDLFGV